MSNWKEVQDGQWHMTQGNTECQVISMEPAWAGYRWRVMRKGEQVAGGVSWSSLQECMAAAEAWAKQPAR